MYLEYLNMCIYLSPAVTATIGTGRPTVHTKKYNTGALRAHTPRAPCNCVIVQLGQMLSPTITYTRTRPSRAHEQKLHV